MVITAYIVKFINAKSAEIQHNVDNDNADKYIAMVADTISACVIATNQTYVEALKKQVSTPNRGIMQTCKISYNKCICCRSSERSLPANL